MLRFSLDDFYYQQGLPQLTNVCFSMHPKSRLFLLGSSGSGKSTLLKILMGLLSGAKGNLKFHNTSYSLHNWKNTEGIFSLVPQTPQLLPWRTIDENLILAQSKKPSTAECKEQRTEILRSVGLMDAANLYPGQISLGMAARVSFARALLLKSQCLLLDEPFASLDAINRTRLQDWLRNTLDLLGMPCIFVTHDVREALKLGTEIMVLGGSPTTCLRRFTDFNDSLEWEKEILAAL